MHALDPAQQDMYGLPSRQGGRRCDVFRIGVSTDSLQLRVCRERLSKYCARSFDRKTVSSKIAMNSIANQRYSMALLEGHADYADNFPSMDNCPNWAVLPVPRTHLFDKPLGVYFRESGGHASVVPFPPRITTLFAFPALRPAGGRILPHLLAPVDGQVDQGRCNPRTAPPPGAAGVPHEIVRDEQPAPRRPSNVSNRVTAPRSLTSGVAPSTRRYSRFTPHDVFHGLSASV
jgi:hypothetical protein